MNPLPDGTDEGVPADVEAELDALAKEYHPSEARLAAAAAFDDQEPIEEELPW